MVIVVTTRYRSEHLNEMAKRYFQSLKDNPTPAYLKEIGPFYNSEHESGNTAMSIYEVSNEKVADALLWIGKAVQAYNGVPDTTVVTKTWITLDEGLKMTGLKAP